MNAMTQSLPVLPGMLLQLSFTNYEGNVRDTKAQAEVETTNNVRARNAARVYKSLFANCKELNAIISHKNAIKQRVKAMTRPWSDNGDRYVAIGAVPDLMAYLAEQADHRQGLVDNFLNRYDIEIAAAAFSIGNMFNRDDYPPRALVAHRFSMIYTLVPIPASDALAGATNEMMAGLRQQYEEAYTVRMQSVMMDSWERLYQMLTRLTRQLEVASDGKKRSFHRTMIPSILEECERLKSYNITNDPDLEQARQKLLDALTGVDTEDLRKDLDLRKVVRATAQELLDNSDWASKAPEVINAFDDFTIED